MSKMLYAFFDGDNVGATIERNLVNEQLQEAQAISENINLALAKIKDEIIKHDQIKILIMGGDDILIEFQDTDSSRKVIDFVRSHFTELTGLSMSCGIGDSIEKAIYGLHLSKLFGKNQICER